MELASQVSFLSRAALSRALDEIPAGGHVLIDAHNTDYIDPDVLDLIREYRDKTGPARNVKVGMLGFRPLYRMEDETEYVDYSTRHLQGSLTPSEVLKMLEDGHDRFRNGRRLARDRDRQVHACPTVQHPLAVVLGCIDFRTPAESIFDVAVGDIYVARGAGNIASPEVLGSLEYACAVAGARLIVVLGHTRCGAVDAAVNMYRSSSAIPEASGCEHLGAVVYEIQKSINPNVFPDYARWREGEKEAFIDDVARRNVGRVIDSILVQSRALASLVQDGRIAIVGSFYDVDTREISFLPPSEGGCAKTSESLRGG